MSDIETEISAEPAAPPAAEPAAPPEPPEQTAAPAFDELGDLYEKLGDQAPPDVAALRKEHQKYREKYQPIAERWDKLGNDAEPVGAFVDALSSGDADTVRTIVNGWYEQLNAGQAPAAPAEQAHQLGQQTPLTPEAIKQVIDAALDERVSQAAQDRQNAERQAEIKGRFEKLGLDLSNPEHMAEAQVIANIARAEGHHDIEKVYERRIGGLSKLLGEPKPTAPTLPTGQAVPAGQPQPTGDKWAQARQRFETAAGQYLNPQPGS